MALDHARARNGHSFRGEDYQQCVQRVVASCLQPPPTQAARNRSSCRIIALHLQLNNLGLEAASAPGATMQACVAILSMLAGDLAGDLDLSLWYFIST